MSEFFFTKSHGFRLFKDSNDVFIHARREFPKCRGKYAGDKIHISVRSDMVPQAFQLLSKLLLLEDSPIDEWKVTDMEQVDPESRVRLGAQFTLYVKPDQENSNYSPGLLLKVNN